MGTTKHSVLPDPVPELTRQDKPRPGCFPGGKLVGPGVAVARHPPRHGAIQRRDQIGVQKPPGEIVETAIGGFPGASRLKDRIGQERISRSRPAGKAAQQSRIQRGRREPASRDDR